MVSSPYTIKIRQATDAGRTFRLLHAGDLVEIEMEEDQYRATEWDAVDPLPDEVELRSRGSFDPSPSDSRCGIRIFVFEIVSAGSFDIELEEINRVWSWFPTASSQGTRTPTPSGRSFKVSFQAL